MHKEINGLIGININLVQFTFNFTLQHMKSLCPGVIQELFPAQKTELIPPGSWSRHGASCGCEA